MLPLELVCGNSRDRILTVFRAEVLFDAPSGTGYGEVPLLVYQLVVGSKETVPKLLDGVSPEFPRFCIERLLC